MKFVSRGIEGVGGGAIKIAQEVGGIVLLTGQVLAAFVPPRIDRRELVKNLYKMGNKSVPIVVLTAFFAGALMVLQAGPFVKKFGFDEVWFGIMYLVCMQLGLLSPPFGLLLFTMKAVAPPEITMTEVIQAALPYMLFGVLLLALIFMWPEVATWLPKQV